MTTHGLDNLPKFVALSYTWGSPDNSRLENSTVYSDKFVVQVNEQNSLVLRNLRDALKNLLGLWNFDDDVQHMWIDAICINQDDITERASQVGIMDEIYRRADTTVVWLGKATRYDKKTTKIFEKICQIPSKDIMPYYQGYPNGTPPPADFWLHRGLPAGDDEEAWKPVVDFFKHRWFDRAWIIQEVTLSTQKIHLFWGRYSLTWEELGHISFVCQVNMIGKLENLPLLSAYLDGDGSHVDTQDWAICDPIANAFQLWLNRQRYLAQSNDPTHDAMRTDVSFLTGCSVPSASSWLLYFSLINRRADATDPRDKIFCNLGLVNNIAKHEGLETSSILADYSPSVTAATVYQQTVAKVIEETDSLALIMALNDPPKSREDGLPSWVADFSRRHGLDLMWSIRPRFNADGSAEKISTTLPATRKIWVSDSYLRARHRVIGAVKVLSVSLADLIGSNWYRWTEDLVDLPNIYSFTGEGCVEAFWRTLLMNSVARQYQAQWPGVQNSNEMFRAYILQSISRHFPGPNSSTSLESYLYELRHLNQLAAQDASGNTPSFTGLRSFTSAITRTPEEELQSVSEETIIEALASSLDKASNFIMGMDGSMLNRRVLISDSGYLVNAPLWARVSDKIAIVDGCPCPVILRENSEQELHYQLVGTAYVHGVMYGEAVEPDMKWQEVCIE
jgi:hypothetical protein